MQKIRFERLPLLILALGTLITGLAAGLGRIGWESFISPTISHHGAIMTGGFLGTLITFEKIIPLKKPWLYAFPLLSATSVIVFFFNPFIAFLLLITASLGLTSVFLTYYLQNRSAVYLLMLTGGICWLTGNVLYVINKFYPVSLPWWMGFVLLIIASERLEIMKFLPINNLQKSMLYVLCGIFLVGCLFNFHGIGTLITGLSVAGIALWLLRFDFIGLTIKKSGLIRFVSVALLSGYISLVISGVFIVVYSSQPMGYDILIHTFFIGFVLAMIFAHGPIILPGLLGISVKPYHKLLYLWLFLLQSSWIIRTIFSFHFNFELRIFSGALTATAIFGYFITLGITTYRMLKKEN